MPWLGDACGACRECLTGWETLCEKQRSTGYSVDGCYAEYFLAEAAFAARVPEGINPFEAAPLTCAGVTTYKALKVAHVRPTELVAISGVGGLGHLALQGRATARLVLRPQTRKPQTRKEQCTMPDHIAGSADELSEDECRILISPGGVGRIAYSGRFGLTVLPVNYQVFEDTIVFRTALDSPMGEDLRSGIANAEYKVAFEIDELDSSERTGWSVLLQGAAHHVDSDNERGSVRASGVEPWAGGTKEHYIRIVPSRITGRRIRQAS